MCAYVRRGLAVCAPRAGGSARKARNETRTRDPFLTMEVLYQLSYPGGLALLSQIYVSDVAAG
jgi:hypothetical protein